tara:strand:- start:303 stop:1184 length:882 start_codon:yes stop_codon:yes gene_type:complete
MELNIYEVGPRDGLQNSSFRLSSEEKISMVSQLHNAGLKNIEVTSFVHPKMVPHLADAEKVFEGTKHLGKLDALIPNRKGFERAKKVGVENFNVFFSQSNEFNLRNLGKNLDKVYPEFVDMLEDVDKANVRAYISCAFGCPFEGVPKEHKLKEAIEMATELADTVVLCDTVGMAHPTKIKQTLELTRGIDAEVALHLHKRKNSGMDILANVESALDWGVNNFDASIGGLGGCQFIPYSGNNLSTNNLISWADDNNYETGIELNDLMEITNWVWKKEILTRRDIMIQEVVEAMI